jgi:hypothetical protein
MKVTNLLDFLVGGVCNIYELPVDEVGKKVPIGLHRLLCSGSCLRWHRAEMERGERSGGRVVLCVLVNKNDDSTVSITITGCIRCDNQFRVHLVRVDL